MELQLYPKYILKVTGKVWDDGGSSSLFWNYGMMHSNPQKWAAAFNWRHAATAYLDDEEDETFGRKMGKQYFG